MATHTEHVYVPCGDYGYDLAFTLYDASGNVFNPTGYAVKLKVWTHDIPASLLLTGVGGITDAANGKVYYTIASGNFNVIGEFDIEIELTKAGRVESFRTHVLHVTESG